MSEHQSATFVKKFCDIQGKGLSSFYSLRGFTPLLFLPKYVEDFFLGWVNFYLLVFIIFLI